VGVADEVERDGRLRDAGNEFGSTTGRPRRCGWLDLVACRYSVRLNGVDSIALTKLDILSGLETVKVCGGYRVRGKTVTSLPAAVGDLEAARPVYEELPGWPGPLGNAREFSDLPGEAQRYIEYLEEALARSITLICVGPERDQVIRRGPG
jgi:adenylosuccinate synthase